LSESPVEFVCQEPRYRYSAKRGDLCIARYSPSARTMRKLVYILTFCLLTLCATEGQAQIYAKLNGLYACVGVINPQVEFRLSNHSTFQTEIVYSPWQSIKGHPMHFGIFMNEYRYFIKEHNRGFYVAANVGMMAFKMSKPQILNGKFSLQNRYCKGYGFMFGAAVGYEYQFCNRWILDAFVGFSWMHSTYNGYSMDGEIDLYPHRPEWKEPPSPDPLNDSAEWMPNKIGLSIGYLIFRPKSGAKKR